MDDNSNPDLIRELQKEVIDLKDQISTRNIRIAELENQVRKQEENRSNRIKSSFKIGIFSSEVLLKLIAGDFLYRKTQTLWDSISNWIKRGEKDELEPAARDFVSALVARLLKISTIGMVLGVLPLLTVLIQTYLIFSQNKIIDQQNALSGFEQASRFRQLLGKPLNETDTQENDGSEKPSPNLSVIDQVIVLGEQQTSLVVKSLKPLLNDKDVVVSSGAFIVIQRLLTHPQATIRRQAEIALTSGEQRNSFNLSVNLRDVDLENIRLDGAKLREAQLQDANLKYTFLSNSDLTEANLVGADLSQTDLIGATLRNAELSCGSSMANSDLTSADMEDISGGPGYSVDYSDDEIPGAYRGGSSGVLCGSFNLSSAKLAYANLKNADLMYANLTEAELTGAKLQGADLRGADLRGAFILRKTSPFLIGLKFYWRIEVIPVSAEYLEKRGAIFDEMTQFGSLEEPK